MSVNVDLRKFNEDGYLVFRNVFDTDRITEYKRKLDTQPKFGGDLLSQEDYADLITDPLITGIARQLIGGQPTYFGCSSISRATTAGTAYWHRDNADRLDMKGPDWGGTPYTPIRFGLYMQDHRNYSGGLLLRPGTHRPDLSSSKTVAYVDTVPGDLVVWNMRLVHAGGGKRLKADPMRPIDIPEANNTPTEALIPEPEGPRYAAFLTYGLSGNEHTERFIDYLATRAYQVDLWKRSTLSARAKELLPNADLHYRDIWAEIKDKPGIGAHVNHCEKAHLAGETKWAEVAASH